MVEVFCFPVAEGDFLWVRYGEEKKSHILIDGGTKEFGYLYKNVLMSIDEKDERIEAIILTHIDNDHIQGAIEGIANTSEDVLKKIVKRIYFNTCSAIQRELKLEKTVCAEKEILASIWKNGYGVGEGIEFLKILKNKKILDRLSDFVIEGQQYDLEDGARMKIISPGEKELKQLAKKWEAYHQRKEAIVYSVGGEAHYQKDLKELMNEKLGNDTSVNNKSSIAFLLTYQGSKMLFLGDANPKVCVEGAKHSEIENPCPVDLIKLSHHGSKANMSDELLSFFPTQYYLVSTDGSRKKVPNKTVLAHLLTASDSEKPVWLLANYEWWADMYHEKYFTEGDKENYLKTVRLKVKFLDSKGIEVNGDIKIYGQYDGVG